MRRKNQLLSLAAVVLAAVAFACPAEAQLYQGVGGVSTLSASPSDLPPGYVQDVVAGNKTRGPYTLTWKGLPSSRERVVIDGRRAIRGADYNIDYAKGLITFTSPLGLTSIARIEYPVDDENATRNVSGLSIPLALDVYSSSRSNLQFSALYKQTDSSAARGGVAILGLTGKSQLSERTKLTSSLYLSPSSGADGGGLGLLDRSGGTLVAQTLLAHGLQFTGSYAHAGSAFAGAKDYGLAAGQSVQDLGLKWDPAGGRMTFKTSYQRVDLAAAGGRSTVNVRHNLGYNIAPGSEFLFARVAAESGAGNRASSTTTDTYTLTRQFGGSTAMRFVMTDINAEGVSASGMTTQHLTLNTTKLRNVVVSASFKTTDSTLAGDDTAVDVGVTAKPYEKLTVAAQFSGRGSDMTGADRSGILRVAALPHPRLKVTAGMSERQTDLLGFRSRDLRLETEPWSFISLSGGYSFSDSGVAGLIIRDISAQATPYKFLKMDAAYKNRDFGPTEINTASLNLSLQPWGFFGVVAAFSENPEDSKGRIQQHENRSLGVKARMGILQLTGDYSFLDEYLAGKEWFQTKLGMGLQVARATQLTSGYEYSETDTGYGVSTRKISLGFRRDLGSDFNLALTGARIDYDDTGSGSSTQEYEAGFRLGARF